MEPDEPEMDLGVTATHMPAMAVRPMNSTRGSPRPQSFQVLIALCTLCSRILFGRTCAIDSQEMSAIRLSKHRKLLHFLHRTKI
jgi:hypothetical protein